MDSRTGKIVSKELVELLPQEEQKHFVPIKDEDLKEVRGMNRAERRAWAKKQRNGAKE